MPPHQRTEFTEFTPNSWRTLHSCTRARPFPSTLFPCRRPHACRTRVPSGPPCQAGPHTEHARTNVRTATPESGCRGHLWYYPDALRSPVTCGWRRAGFRKNLSYREVSEGARSDRWSADSTSCVHGCRALRRGRLAGACGACMAAVSLQGSGVGLARTTGRPWVGHLAVLAVSTNRY